LRGQVWSAQDTTLDGAGLELAAARLADFHTRLEAEGVCAYSFLACSSCFARVWSSRAGSLWMALVSCVCQVAWVEQAIRRGCPQWIARGGEGECALEGLLVVTGGF
jgi:hypothetical protein